MRDMAVLNRCAIAHAYATGKLMLPKSFVYLYLGVSPKDNNGHGSEEKEFSQSNLWSKVENGWALLKAAIHMPNNRAKVRACYEQLDKSSMRGSIKHHHTLERKRWKTR